MKSFYETYDNARLARDRGAFAPPACDNCNVVVLEAGVKKAVILPTDVAVVVFSGEIDFFAKFGSLETKLTLPTSDVADGSAGEFNPAARQKGDAGVLHLISQDSGFIQLSFYGA